MYFRLLLIEKYLKSLPRFRIIKVFYDDTKCENPFKIKFPFISYFEDIDKKQEYYHKIKELHRTKNKNKGKKEINERIVNFMKANVCIKKLLNLIIY